MKINTLLAGAILSAFVGTAAFADNHETTSAADPAAATEAAATAPGKKMAKKVMAKKPAAKKKAAAHAHGEGEAAHEDHADHAE